MINKPGIDMKHKLKRTKGYSFLIVSYCIHCGLMRLKKGDTYLYGSFDNQSEIIPECNPEKKIQRLPEKQGKKI